MIPFNKPFFSGRELEYIRQAVDSGKISGDGLFSRKCQDFLQQRYGYGKTLLTTSCTDALEMIAILCNLQNGDEIIAPSFTFVSTVNPFVRAGANIIFCDVRPDYPCIDEERIEMLITARTRAIIVTHYAGIACNMDRIVEIADTHQLIVVEDAAHAIEAYYKGRPLGGIGQFGAFSFHETKNIIAGEGGSIVLNEESYYPRAEIIREKGTNRAAFFRGQIDKYTWVDIGSSFLPSEITAAFLYAQLENIDFIQQRRMMLWKEYYQHLQPLENAGKLKLPVIPPEAGHNAHLFYLVTRSTTERSRLIACLDDHQVMAISHYQPLHSSPFWEKYHQGGALAQTDRFAETLLRLPLYHELTTTDVQYISQIVTGFYDRC